MTDESQDKKQWPCKVTETGIMRCWALDEVLEYPHGQGTKYQGLKLHSMVNMKTNEFSRHLVVLKSGKHSKRGIALNFCPFCREELLEGAAETLEKRGQIEVIS